jgi:hypothetical protein
MKRLLSSLWSSPTVSRGLAVAVFGAAAIVLGGCPVYPDNPTGYRTCDGNTCYSCPSQGMQDSCVPWQCGGDQDCPNGYSCNLQTSECQSYGAQDAGAPAPPVDATTSVPPSCSQPSDCPGGYTCAGGGTCELGDCSITGCLAGYVCELENGSLECVLESTGTTPDAGTDSGVGCQSNNDCASTQGAICLDGTCVPPSNQCFDESQCPPGDVCVQGACTPSCQVSADGGSTACPTGYSCTNIGDAAGSAVCTGNPTPCESNPNACPVGTVCSQNHCVASCGAGGACPANEQCVQGGCVPSQIPSFTCTNEGVQDSCASGSICLHHSCYIACSPDAGASGCQSADQFNECKPVTASGSTYYVCGSATNLGNQCDPTEGQQCSSSAAVCIDGYCY